MRALGVIFCVLALAACDEKTVAGPSVPVNRAVVLAPGETAAIAEAGISVRFLGVSSDSRCPGDATCITAGDATVLIDVMPPSDGRSQYDLHTAVAQPVRHGDLTVALVELDPYPFASRPIQPGDYRATLRIAR